METQTAEIAPNIYRLSTYVQDANLVFNQFLVVDEQPLLFHAGLRALLPAGVLTRSLGWFPVEQLRWISPSATSRLTSVAR